MAQLDVDVLGSLDGVVEVFEQQRQHDAEDQPDYRGDTDDSCLLRAVGHRPHHSRIDDAGDRRLQIAGDVGFLHAGGEHLVQTLVRGNFALEYAKFVFLAVHAENVALALRQRSLHRAFLGTGKFVFLGDAGDDGVDLAFGVLACSAVFRIRGLTFGMFRPVFLGGVSQPALGGGLDALELSVESAFLDCRNRFDIQLRLVCALYLLIRRLGLGPFLPRRNQSF